MIIFLILLQNLIFYYQSIELQNINTSKIRLDWSTHKKMAFSADFNI